MIPFHFMSQDLVPVYEPRGYFGMGLQIQTLTLFQVSKELRRERTQPRGHGISSLTTCYLKTLGDLK